MHTQATDAEPEAVEYRGKVRARDRETSWDAASAQTNTKTAALQILIYRELLEHGPKTDEELLIRLARLQPVSPSGIRTRRHELEVAGWVTEHRVERPAKVGMPPASHLVKRRLLSGKLGTVWRAVTDDEPAPIPRPKAAPKPKAAKLDHERGLKAARALATWELGSAVWATMLIRAYLDPEAAEAQLKKEQGE